MAAETSPAFLFYVTDWRGWLKVRAMNFATRGMFLELLLEQWHSGAVARVALGLRPVDGGASQEWTRAWPKLRGCFVVRKRDGLLVNPKLRKFRVPDGAHALPESAGARWEKGLDRAMEEGWRA